MNKELILEHEVYFEFDGPVSVKDATASMEGLATIIRQLPLFLNDLQKAGRIPDVEVFVREIHEGSLLQKYLLKLMFKSDEDLNAFLERWSKKLNLDNLSDKVKIGIIIAAIVGAAGFQYVGSKLGQPAINITGDNNIIVRDVSIQLEVSQEQIERALEKSVMRKPTEMMEAAHKLIRPARAAKDGGTIHFNGKDAGGVKLSKESINEFPREFKKPPASEEDIPYENIELMVRATDRDNLKTGWAVVIPKVSSDRIRMVISPKVNLDKIVRYETVRGDVIVTYKINEKGHKKPVLCHLLKLSEKED